MTVVFDHVHHQRVIYRHMKLVSITLQTCLFLILLIGAASAQQPKNDAPLSSNAPADRNIPVTKDEAQKFLDLIKPYVEKARKTYPDAKARYLKGLPKGEVFFVTARLTDPEGHWEQVFIRVKEIRDAKIKGVIASDIELVRGYKNGDEYTLAEADLLDWTISKPDGTEEGNFVGNFLDHYHPDQIN